MRGERFSVGRFQVQLLRVAQWRVKWAEETVPIRSQARTEAEDREAGTNVNAALEAAAE